MGANTIPTVGYVAQTNRDAYILHDYLPKRTLKPDSTILTQEEISKESKNVHSSMLQDKLLGCPLYFWRLQAISIADLEDLLLEPLEVWFEKLNGHLMNL